jgi:hypothetical protein
MNTRFSDVASELTDSLSRSGKGPMLSALKLYSGGSASVPELSWNDDVDTGLYLIGDANVGLSIAGTKRWDFAAAGSTLTGTLAVSGGVSTDTVTANTATSATVKGAVADGASAVGVVLDNTIALANATAKLASFRSNGVEKASINASGQFLSPAIELIQGNAFIDFKDSAGEDYDARIIKSTGANLEVTGTPLKVMTPVASTDAATKGYVDTTTDGVGSISWGTGWGDAASSTRLRRGPDGLTTFNLVATLSSGTAVVVASLPSGFRPGAQIGTTGYDNGGNAVGFLIAGDEVRINALGSAITGATYYASFVYWAPAP